VKCSQRAQLAHHHAQRDVDHVVARTAAVREAGIVAVDHAQALLRAIAAVGAIEVFRRSISDAVTLAGWFTPGRRSGRP
jgi:hypothetical protein